MVGGEIGKMVLESIYTERLCIFYMQVLHFFAIKECILYHPLRGWNQGLRKRVKNKSE